MASNSVKSLANVFSTPTDLRMRFARTDRSSMPRAEIGSEKRKRLVPDVEPCSKAERVQSEGVRLLRGHFLVVTPIARLLVNALRLPPEKADIMRVGRHVRFVPTTEVGVSFLKPFIRVHVGFSFPVPRRARVSSRTSFNSSRPSTSEMTRSAPALPTTGTAKFMNLRSSDAFDSGRVASPFRNFHEPATTLNTAVRKQVMELAARLARFFKRSVNKTTKLQGTA